jgi:hypothetical protein
VTKEELIYFIDASDMSDTVCEEFYKIIEEHSEYALLLSQPCGESHHNANKCPYCMENLNGKT